MALQAVLLYWAHGKDALGEKFVVLSQQAAQVYGMKGEIQWVMFAEQAKPSSMRRAIATLLLARDSVLIVTEAQSFRAGGWRKVLSPRGRRSSSTLNLIEYSPLHFPERIPFIRRLSGHFSRALLTSEVKRLLGPRRTEGRVVCFDSPSQHGLVGGFHEDVALYLAIDDRVVNVSGEPVQGELEAEKVLLSKVDLVICVSDFLAERLRGRTPQGRNLPVKVLTNGYDDRVFSPTVSATEPYNLAPIRRPRILVAGHVSDRIDWKGVEEAAILRPDWAWVFVGPVDQSTGKLARELEARMSPPFIYLCPPVRYEEVPAWIMHCDACAVPYRLNDFTLASSPLKALEYLGSGAPLLATRIPSLAGFGDNIAWVEEGNGSSYARALDRMLEEGRSAGPVARRLRVVQGETWSRKVLAFREMVTTL